MQIDAIDLKILSILQKEGRLPNSDLAERIALSPSACYRRVQWLEITLSGQSDEIMEAFERQVALVPDVMECHLMAGSADYILKVVAHDTDDFARIHKQYLARLPGVAQMQSSFALRTVFKTTALPL